MTADTDEFELDEAVANRFDDPESGTQTNVGRWERVASAVVGGVLVIRGLRRRSLGGVVTAAIGGALLARGVRGHSRLYRSLASDEASDQERLHADAGAETPSIERTITVGKPADELEDYWRDPDHLDRFVGELADVSAATGGDDHHHWRVRGPLGRELEWESRLAEEESGERLQWETLDGAPVPYEATVEFRPAPADRGTEVALRLQYDPPGGPLGDAAMQRLGIVPGVLAERTLNRFKSLAETGEIPSLETNPSGRGKGDLI